MKRNLFVLLLAFGIFASACEEAVEIEEESVEMEKTELGSFVLDRYDFSITFPDRWTGVEIMEDFAGFCPKEDAPGFEVPGRAFTILLPEENGGLSGDITPMFVVTSIDKADTNKPCIPDDAKFIGENNTSAYFVEKITATNNLSFLYVELPEEKKALLEDIDGIIEMIELKD